MSTMILHAVIYVFGLSMNLFDFRREVFGYCSIQCQLVATRVVAASLMDFDDVYCVLV